jgi:hypothetical protein
MGLDFIRRAARTFTKSWSRGARDLAQPTLFTRYPECRTRTIIAQLDEGGVALSSGTQLAICSEGQQLLLVLGTARVGVVESPPADLFRAIQSAGGCALGSLASINPLSGTADVEIE